MEGPADGSRPTGWERLLEAQSEYIANLQRMLHSACQNAAALKQQPESEGLRGSGQWREAAEQMEDVVSHSRCAAAAE
eukprot:4542065-Amphidinium_carterae.1